jgi:hypothetical protein
MDIVSTVEALTGRPRDTLKGARKARAVEKWEYKQKPHTNLTDDEVATAVMAIVYVVDFMRRIRHYENYRGVRKSTSGWFDEFYEGSWNQKLSDYENYRRTTDIHAYEFALDHLKVVYGLVEVDAGYKSTYGENGYTITHPGSTPVISKLMHKIQGDKFIRLLKVKKFPDTTLICSGLTKIQKIVDTDGMEMLGKMCRIRDPLVFPKWIWKIPRDLEKIVTMSRVTEEDKKLAEEMIARMNDRSETESKQFKNKTWVNYSDLRRVVEPSCL